MLKPKVPSLDGLKACKNRARGNCVTLFQGLARFGLAAWPASVKQVDTGSDYKG